MDRIELCRTFVRVVDCASFTRAAQQLNLPRSNVSDAVRSLEQHLGVRLLHRTTRQVSPTADGLLFYQRCVQLVADMEAAEQMFRHAADCPSGHLRVSVPGRIGRRVLAPALPGFVALHPQIQVELAVTDRQVDLVEDGVDCALRVGPLRDSRLVARELGQLPLVNVASAGYLQRHGTPTDPQQLDAHWGVLYTASHGRSEPWEWLADGQLHGIALRGQVTTNDVDSQIALCLAGLGLIQVPAYDVRAELADGRLREVMPQYRAAPLPVSLLYPHRQPPPRLQVFVQWLVPLLQEHGLFAA